LRSGIKQRSYGWVILALTTLAQSSVSVLSQSTAPIAPFVQAEFGLSRSELGYLNIALASGSYLTLIVSGRLLDRVGERWMLLASGLISGGFALSMLFAPAFAATLGLVALMSIGTVIATPAGTKAVMGWFAPRLRGTAMSIRQVGIPVGGMTAGLLLPSLALAVGWRGALAIGGVIAIVGTLVCITWYREPPEVVQQTAGSRELVGFREVLRERELWLISLYGIAMIAAQFTFSLYIVVFAHDRLGWSPVASGGLLAVGQGVAIGARILWGTASDRLFGGDRRVPLAIVAVIAGLGSIGLSFVDRDAPSWIVVAATAVLGASALGWQGIYVAAVSELAGHRAAGTALGVSLTIAQLGQLIAPPLFGLLADLTNSYQPSWIALGLFILLASLPVHWVRRSHERP
jgi:MFS transporter, ACS family, hexuronate transporter